MKVKVELRIPDNLAKSLVGVARVAVPNLPKEAKDEDIISCLIQLILEDVFQDSEVINKYLN